MNKVHIIVGGSGFLGSNMATFLRTRKDNDVIIGVDKRKKNNFCYDKFYVLDFSKIEDVKILLNLLDSRDYYYIYNFGANIGNFNYLKTYNGEEDFLINRGAMDLLHNLPNSTLFFPSSSQVYSKKQLSNKGDKGEPKPETPYGKEKLGIELYLFEYGKKYNREKDVKVARIFNVYGEFDDYIDPPRVIPALCKKVLKENKEISILGNGKQRRSFIYIRDAFEAIDTFVNSDLGTLEIGSSNIYTIDETVDMLLKISGKKLDKVYENKNDVVDDIICNNKDLIHNTRWGENYSFINGLTITYNYYKKEIKHENLYQKRR